MKDFISFLQIPAIILVLALGIGGCAFLNKLIIQFALKIPYTENKPVLGRLLDFVVFLFFRFTMLFIAMQGYTAFIDFGRSLVNRSRNSSYFGLVTDLNIIILIIAVLFWFNTFFRKIPVIFERLLNHRRLLGDIPGTNESITKWSAFFGGRGNQDDRWKKKKEDDDFLDMVTYWEDRK